MYRKKRKRKRKSTFVINGALRMMFSVQLLWQPCFLSFPFGDAMPLWVTFKLMKLFLTSMSSLRCLSTCVTSITVDLWSSRCSTLTLLALPKRGEADFWFCVHWIRQDATDCLIFNIISVLWSWPCFEQKAGPQTSGGPFTPQLFYKSLVICPVAWQWVLMLQPFQQQLIGSRQQT